MCLSVLVTETPTIASDKTASFSCEKLRNCSDPRFSKVQHAIFKGRTNLKQVLIANLIPLLQLQLMVTRQVVQRDVAVVDSVGAEGVDAFGAEGAEAHAAAHDVSW